MYVKLGVFSALIFTKGLLIPNSNVCSNTNGSVECISTEGLVTLLSVPLGQQGMVRIPQKKNGRSKTGLDMPLRLKRPNIFGCNV